MIFLQLAYEFFKTGLFAVGGGLATLPFLYEMSEKTAWFTTDDISNMIAISESTPGPMGVNMATYVGFMTGSRMHIDFLAGNIDSYLCGIWGGIVATIGLVTPSIIVIIIVANFLQRFKDSKLVAHVFYGLRPASTALITAAGLGVFKIALLKLDIFAATGQLVDLFFWKGLLMAAIIWFALKKWKGHPILYIVISAACGIVFQFGA